MNETSRNSAEFAAIVNQALKDSGKSITEFYTNAGIAYETFRKMRMGIPTSKESIEKFAKAANLNVREVLAIAGMGEKPLEAVLEVEMALRAVPHLREETRQKMMDSARAILEEDERKYGRTDK
jgi:hypothetical protein